MHNNYRQSINIIIFKSSTEISTYIFSKKKDYIPNKLIID